MTKSSQLGPRHSRRSNCLGIPAITDQSIPSQIRCAGARPGQPPTTAAPPQLRHTTQEPGAQTAAPHSPDEPKCPNHVINNLSQLRLAPMRSSRMCPLLDVSVVSTWWSPGALREPGGLQEAPIHLIMRADDALMEVLAGASQHSTSVDAKCIVDRHYTRTGSVLCDYPLLCHSRPLVAHQHHVEQHIIPTVEHSCCSRRNSRAAEEYTPPVPVESERHGDAVNGPKMEPNGGARHDAAPTVRTTVSRAKIAVIRRPVAPEATVRRERTPTWVPTAS